MSNNIKVIYDISQLAHGYKNKSHQTGIFRVVESLALELVQSDECQITFCSRFLRHEASQYLTGNHRLAHVPLSTNSFAKAVEKKLVKTSDAITEASALKKLYLRSQRKVFHHLSRAVNVEDNPLDTKLLKSADIYHDPGFAAIFPQVKRPKHLKRMQTIYDVTPMLFPNLFADDHHRHSLQRLIDNISPDNWALAISQATKDDLCNYAGLDPCRVFVTHLAADSALFYPCSASGDRVRVNAKYGIPDMPYILSLCTLEPRKNLDHVIRCFVRLVHEQKFDNVNLVLAGGKGWLYDRIFSELRSEDALALKGRIVLTGFVDNQDLAPLYSNALCFVYPSLYEGFGLPPLEAMQCGVPVITSNTSSLPEVIGDAGIMLNPKDEDGMCQSLLDFSEKPSYRDEMARRALSRSGMFSWERCAQETISAYRTALSA